MANLVVRTIDEDIVKALKERGGRFGRSARGTGQVFNGTRCRIVGRTFQGCANMPPSIIALYAVGLDLAHTASPPKIGYDAGPVWFRSAE